MKKSAMTMTVVCSFGWVCCHFNPNVMKASNRSAKLVPWGWIGDGEQHKNTRLIIKKWLEI
jgi:hypothetical protein